MPVIGEIRMFAGNYVPEGWAACDGSLLAIADNEPLFHLIGTNYGGDGATTFGVPDMRGRLPLGANQSPSMTPYPLAAQGGQAQVALSATQAPAHGHTLMGTSAPATSSIPSPFVMLATTLPTVKPYNDLSSATGTLASLSPAAIEANASPQAPHNNIMPSLGIMFIIALNGAYPNTN